MDNSAESKGYAISEEDRKTLHNKDQCELCKNVLKAAVQTSCGHRYCSMCLEEEFVDGKAKCTACQEPLTRKNIFRDKFADREIQSLILFCVYCVFGCKWRGQLCHREEHQKTCKFIPFPCSNHGCDKQVTKDSLANHLKNECLYREMRCSYCEHPVVYSNFKEHESTCLQFPVKCKHCNKNLPRKKMKEHLNASSLEVCELIEPQCPFVGIGCKENTFRKRRDRDVHMQKNTAEHLVLLLAKFHNFLPYIEELIPAKPNGKTPNLLQVLKIEILLQLNARMDSVYKLTEEKIKHLEAKCESMDVSAGGLLREPNKQELLRRLENSDAKIANLELLLKESHDTNADLRLELTKTNVKLEKAEEIIRKIERRLEDQENTAGIRNLAVADLEEKMNVVVNNSVDGILLWRIDHVARRRADATSGRQISFYSPPFYTDPHGYKMCARIYLNGDGMGKRNYISLFFVIMRGEYDALLKWPFRQKVTMMLLDQDNEEHVIDAFRPDPNSSSFQKPNAPMNIASGCPMFCPHSELQRHAYIRDDVMYIKIIVDRPDWK